MIKKRVTIAEVAEAAGVSPTAVSFAFNRPDQLGQETIARIMQAAEELGYAPNPHAKALLSGRSGALGLLVPQSLVSTFANPFFATFLEGMGAVCDEKELALLTLSPFEDSLEQALARAPVDGFVIVGLNEAHEEVAPLRRRKVPFVIVDGDSEHVPSVNSDDEEGAYRAAVHLLAQGHRDLRIFTFETPYGHLEYVYYGVGGRRMRGYRRAFEEAGLGWEEALLHPTVATIEGGARSFTAAWESGLRPTAVLAVSDAMAIGIVQAAGALGLDVPGDLEVVGFDDVPLASLVSPALSTVHQPIEEKGRTAAELLVEALESARAAHHVLLETALVLRETTRDAVPYPWPDP